MSEFVQVVTTTGSETEARLIATALVDARLAACVHARHQKVSLLQ